MDSDYTVGSLSALITGKKNKSKTKIVAEPMKVVAEETQEVPETPEVLQTTNSRKRKHSVADANAKVSSKKSIKAKREITTEDTKNTIMVTNVPLTAKMSNVKKFFEKFGQIDRIRFRAAPVKNPKLPLFVSIMKKDFLPHRKSWMCYVKFVDEDSAKKAVEAHGEVFEEHHLEVKLTGQKDNRDENKAIFIGNFHFKAENEDLWKLFGPCGKISSIKIPRDRHAKFHKGYAYINFENSDSVQLALQMRGVQIFERELNIQPCNAKAAQKNKDKNIGGNKRKIPTKIKPRKERQRRNDEGKGGNNNDENTPEKKGNKSYKENSQNSFQGSKIQKKKTGKKNMGLIKKKRLAKQIAPRVKQT